MAIVIDGNNIPTAGTVAVGNGTSLAFTSTGTTGQVLLSQGSSTPIFGNVNVSAITGVLTGTNGGTGVNNGSSTITIGGNVTMSGAYTFTGTLTGNTSVTFPTSGTLVNTSVTSLSSLSTVGTLTSGTWNASVVQPTYGGTGVNNGSSTITIGGNVTYSGAYTQTFVATGNTSVTLPTSGTLSALSGTNSWTGTQTFNGTSSAIASVLLDVAETVNIVGSAPSSTTNFYIQSGSVQYYTSNASTNWTLNIAFSSGTSLNTALSTGQSITIAMLATQGSTAYYNSAITIDGTSVSPLWQGGTAPSAGFASGVDVYTYTVIKTGSATYTVLATLTQF